MKTNDAFVAFGELLLRLSAPDHENLLQSPSLKVFVGGAEANVAVSLAQMGHQTRFASVIPANHLGRGARNELRRTMTVLPEATPVNVNTAPPEVIAALVPGMSLSQAQAMTGERDRGNWFNNAGDFANRLAGTGVKGAAPAVATNSGWFLATGTVAYERARISLHALMRSSPPAAPDTLWTRENP